MSITSLNGKAGQCAGQASGRVRNATLTSVTVAAGPSISTQPQPSTGRAIAMLRAVAGRRAEVCRSVSGGLRIDGLLCCDQFTALSLCRAGLIRPCRRAAADQWVEAELTAAGRQAIGELRAAG